MVGCTTTVCVGSHGQLLVTIPKQVAELTGIEKGTKVCWKIDENTGKLKGEVKLNGNR